MTKGYEVGHQVGMFGAHLKLDVTHVSCAPPARFVVNKKKNTEIQ